mmetsp:Transcript_18365/g.60314  ORF Transcript_18365/g.60314 Transcript_18365/m.60314 type:complete len:693 (+) Transcript_18365:1669-3747(+)
MTEAAAAGDSSSLESLNQFAHHLALFPVSQSYGRGEKMKIRTGALAAAASFVLGLGPVRSKDYLHILLPSVASCAKDTDRKVRLAALESLYNICRTVRQAISPFCALLMDSLIAAANEQDDDVAEALLAVESLLQIIVCESNDISAVNILPTFLAGFRLDSSCSSCAVLRWIIALESSPWLGRDLLHNHAELTQAIFMMTSHNDNSVKTLALECLEQFHDRAIDALNKSRHPFSYCEVLEVLFNQCRGIHEGRWSMAVRWIRTIIRYRTKEIHNYTAELLDVLVALSERARAGFHFDVVEQVEHCLAELEAEVTQILWTGVKWSAEDQERIANVTVEVSKSDNRKLRFTVLKWFKLLLSYHPECLVSDKVFISVLSGLEDDEQAAELCIDIVGQIFRTKLQESSFKALLQNLLNFFKEKRVLLDTRASLAINMLCDSIGPEQAFTSVCEILTSEDDILFVGEFVEKLNQILLLESRMNTLRSKLPNFRSHASSSSLKLRSRGSTEEQIKLFGILFSTFVVNEVAALSIALLCQAYEMSSFIVGQIMSHIHEGRSASTYNRNALLLTRLDKLIRMFELPVWARMRLDFMDPQNNRHLKRCMESIDALMPQSNTWKIFRKRLKTLQVVEIDILEHFIQECPRDKPSQQRADAPRSSGPAEEEENLTRGYFDTFMKGQDKISRQILHAGCCDKHR